MSAEAIWEEVVAAVRTGQPRKIGKLADQFSNETLLGDQYPEDYFAVLLIIFSDSEVQRSKQIFKFLVDLIADKDRLSEDQFDRLAKSLLANIERFGDEMLVHTAVDFVCRYYPRDEVPDLLKMLATKNIPNKDAFLHMGASIAVSNGKMDKDAAIKFLRENGVPMADK